MIPELRKAIYNIGKTITGLSSRFYFSEAPENVDFPYAVFSQVANSNSRDSASTFEEIYININFYDDSAAGAEAIANTGKARFDDSEDLLNTELTEYSLERIERQLTRDQKLDDIFMVSLQYKLELSKGSQMNRPYKVYSALISQNGVVAPVLIEMENQFNGITTFYQSDGSYYIQSTNNEFIENKTVVFLTNGTNVDSGVGASRMTDGIVWISTRNPFHTLSNGILTMASLEIRVYT